MIFMNMPVVEELMLELLKQFKIYFANGLMYWVKLHHFLSALPVPDMRYNNLICLDNNNKIVYFDWKSINLIL